MNNTDANHPDDIARTLELDRSSGGVKNMTRWFGWAGLILVLVVAVLTWGYMGNNDPVQYKTEAVGKGELIITVTATGNLEPTNKVDVGIEASGTIETVEVDYNDSVEAGQVLARLDTTKFEAQVLQSKAALAAAGAKVLQVEATFKEANNELARLQQARKLSGGKVPSLRDMDAAVAALNRAQADRISAKAAVSEAKATLSLHQTDLGKAVIYSPINGIVLVRAVEPGQTVAASFQAPVLFTLAEDLTEMELHVDVDEADVGQVKAGQVATFTVDAYPERTFPAQITQVRFGSQEVEGVISYETVLNVDNAELFLRPGMTATAEVTVKKIDNTMLVPNAALRFTPPVVVQQDNEGSGSLLGNLLPRPPSSVKSRIDMKQQQVWTVRDGEAVVIPVNTGSTDGVMTEVISGDIQAGMELIVDILSSSK